MYQKILVPFDGSEHAENALRSAISLLVGREASSQITVVYVQRPLSAFAGAGAIAYANINMDELLKEESEHIKKDAKDIISPTGIKFDAVFKAGDPATEICDIAETSNYDLIVMGSRGLGLMTGLALGSVSHKVVQHTTKPVLIVK